MSKALGMLELDELGKLARQGEIETVIVGFTDHYGRLMGKRFDAEMFVQDIAEHGAHACDYLLTVDMEMDPVPGYKFANWELGYGDFHLVPDMKTLRRASWLEKTALVICDVKDEKTHDLVAVARAEKVVLELGRGEHAVTLALRRVDLPAQNRARSDLDQIVCLFVSYVADHQRRLLEPARAPQRLHVRHEVEVAVAELPVGELVAGHRLHLHVDGEQIVAGMRAMLGDVFHEEFGVEALAEEPSVMVGEADHHGLDLARARELCELGEIQYAERFIHRACGK